MSLKAIDISNYQSVAIAGSTDADIVIVKVSEGTGYVSPKADQQYQLAKSKGKLLGFYHYAAGGNATAEANYFYNNAKNYFHEAVPILDWEQGTNAAWGNGAWAKTFIDRIKALSGVTPLLYTGSDGVAQTGKYLANDAGLWFAGYPDLRDSWNAPDFMYSTGAWNNLTGWQYTDSNGKLDRSIFYLDKAAWQRIANPSGNSKPVTPSKSATKPKIVPITVTYALRSLNGGWLDNVTNFGSGDNGFAGIPNQQHDYLTVSVNHGSVKYRVKTAQDGWLGWVSDSNRNDLSNGAAGIAGHAITGVQIVYNTPAGEDYQQAYYRSQTTQRIGWLHVCADDGSIPGLYRWSGMDGEPLDRLQIKISPSNPF